MNLVILMRVAAAMAIPKPPVNQFLSIPLIAVLPSNLRPFPSSLSSSVDDDNDDEGVVPPRASSVPHLSFSKPSWVVQTQSNVRRMVRKKPNPPCVVCDGSGRVDCNHCLGKGRTNYTHLMMLPGGKWPKWCKTCGGSGLCYCDRCLGTGEYRDVLGFHFLRKTDTTQASGPITRKNQGNEHLGAADFLLSEPVNPEDESS